MYPDFDLLCVHCACGTDLRRQAVSPRTRNGKSRLDRFRERISLNSESSSWAGLRPCSRLSPPVPFDPKVPPHRWNGRGRVTTCGGGSDNGGSYVAGRRLVTDRSRLSF